MDIKLKNIRYKTGVKLISYIIIILSFIIFIDSGYFIINNKSVIIEKSYKETKEYESELNRLIHNTVEFATRFNYGKNKESDIERYEIIEENLTKSNNYYYYIEDVNGDIRSYKIPKEYDIEAFKNLEETIFIDKNNIPSILWYKESIDGMLSNSPKEIYVYIPPKLTPGDEFYNIYYNYSNAKEKMPYAIGGISISIVLMILSFTHLMITSGRKHKGSDIYLIPIDNIYVDIQILIVSIIALLSLIINGIFNFSFYTDNPINIIFIFTIITLNFTIQLICFFSVVRNIKNKSLGKNTLIYNIINNIVIMLRKIYNKKIFRPWIIILVGAYAFINGILFIITFNGYFEGFVIGFILLVLLNILALYLTYKKLESLSQVMKLASETSNGNLDYNVDKSQISLEFQELASNIENIQSGIRKAVDEAIKVERMKTDLVANVSHDLKTPLTSIINYLELLKQEEIDNTKAKEYIEILDDKSLRLKQLIEDLVEASKASSGNLTINKDKVSVYELINQGCGEYEEKFKNANLDLRINEINEELNINADGKYMWRIVENLLSNIIKYSMPGSRVYIDIEGNNGFGVFIFKNISMNPLDITPDQLTQRFIRGDKSRTTEGSGLGLSIAESLTIIQGGTFKIEIDGDLFKVILEMPLYK